MKKQLLLLLALVGASIAAVPAATPVDGLLERIDPGASKKFKIERVVAPGHSRPDFFELDQQGDRVVVRGSDWVSISAGVNWYLKYYAGIHLSWNAMQARLPERLPAVPQRERHETRLAWRYAYNYCTYSYTMAFWDWERWEREIDWMALHGINLPLAVVGTDAVWRGVLEKLGYGREEIDRFIAGPAFQAWWLMNNLEGWGGPNSDAWYEAQVQLQRRILKRMRELGIHPVLPGYGGMVPHDARERLGLDVSDPGLWCGYRRPAFLQPEDPRFAEIAALYYDELTRLYGKADFYSMDPFHEGGSARGVDLPAAGRAILGAMKRANPAAKWVAQAWQANPRRAMIEALPKGDLIVLDLFSESRPQWGDPASTWYRPEGFCGHDWIYCMLLNYGGNVGLHGKLTHVVEEFYRAKASPFVRSLRGVGMTMEGTENNPVMYELLCELPWRAERFDVRAWLMEYVDARYGRADERVHEAWALLGRSIYDCPAENVQQGTHESIFCSRPGMEVRQASSWAERDDYYDPQEVIRAAGLMVEASEAFRGNDNFAYDLIDIVRQAVAEKGRLVYGVVVAAIRARDRALFDAAAERFLGLLLLQDRLLSTRAEFCVGRWIDAARRRGASPEEADRMEWNARVQITTWGDRTAADASGLHDYAHKEWSGLLRDFYYPRWKQWLDNERERLDGGSPAPIDFYAMEEPWTLRTGGYAAQPEGDALATAAEVYREAFGR